MLQEATSAVEAALMAGSAPGDPNAADRLLRKACRSYECVRSSDADESGLLVAARQSIQRGVQTLQSVTVRDGEFGSGTKKKVARTRMMAVAVRLAEPLAGMEYLNVVNVHLHYMTAKKDGNHEMKQAWEFLGSAGGLDPKV
jgi:hypothetical protein